MGTYSLMKDETAMLLGKIYQKRWYVVMHGYIIVCTVLARGDQTEFIHAFKLLQMKNAPYILLLVELKNDEFACFVAV